MSADFLTMGLITGVWVGLLYGLYGLALLGRRWQRQRRLRRIRVRRRIQEVWE